MKKKVTVKPADKPAERPEVIGELEFSQAADVLLEAIYQYYKRRDNEDLTHEQAVEIATQVLRSRG